MLKRLRKEGPLYIGSFFVQNRAKTAKKGNKTGENKQTQGLFKII